MEPSLDAAAPFFLQAALRAAGGGRRSDEPDQLLDLWRDRGVRALPARFLGATGINGFNPDAPLFISGAPLRTRQTTAAVLCSRQPRRVSPTDRWITVVRELFETARLESDCLVSSLGSRPYELICLMAARAGVDLWIVLDGPLPEMGDQSGLDYFLKKHKGLFPEGRTTFFSAFPPGPQIPLNQRRPLRDELTAGLASKLYFGEVSAKGNMISLARKALEQGRKVFVFRPEVFDRKTAGARELLETGAKAFHLSSVPEAFGKKPVQQRIGVGIKSRRVAFSEPQLIHYTRSAPGSWPGQRLCEYLSSLLDDEPGAAHTARDAMTRILLERKLRAGSRMTRGEIGVVSFTSLGPDRLDALIEWRPGLVRWTMEPYGLAWPRRVLAARGARPAVYGGEETWRRLPEGQKYRFQKKSSRTGSWSKEKEWRRAGDLVLDEELWENLTLILPTRREAEETTARFGRPAVWLQSGD